jgi:hypothetical protein
MAAATLDTHAMVKRLVATGMPKAQAEAVVEIVSEGHEAAKAELVTREVLRYELALVEERLNKRMDALDARIGTLDKDLTIRLGGMLAAAIAIIGALVALF